MTEDDNIRNLKRLAENYRAKGVKVKLTEIKIPKIPTDNRDRILGAYMNSISTLEHILQLLFWTLLQTDLLTARCVFSKLGFQQIEELLPALGRFSLSDDDQDNLKRLCRRFHRAALKRNRIIHAQWATNIISMSDDDPPIAKVEWLRIFTATDRKAEERINEDQKTAAKHRFDIKAIARAANDVLALAKDISDFRASLTYVPEPPLGRESPIPPSEHPDKDQ